MFGVEAGGHGVDDRDEHAAPLTGGAPGVLHGNRTHLLLHGRRRLQRTEAHSISAGLDHPGIGPEHAWLKELARVQLRRGRPMQRGAGGLPAVLAGWRALIPALEPSHALAHVAIASLRTCRATI